MEGNSMLEWNKSCVCWRQPGADMNLILMHFYVSPVVQRDAWDSQDEIPQWFFLHCIKASGCRPKTDAFWRSRVIYDLFMILNIKVSFFYTQFLIKSKLDLSALSALCCSLLLIVTLYFRCILYIDVFILFLLSYQRFFIFIHVFVVLSTVLTMTCISDQTMWNYELGVLSTITTIKMQFVGISYWFQET